MVVERLGDFEDPSKRVMTVKTRNVKLDWWPRDLRRWWRSGRHVRETLAHGLKLVGQVRMFLGEGSNGLLEAICGGAAGSMLCHGKGQVRPVVESKRKKMECLGSRSRSLLLN